MTIEIHPDGYYVGLWYLAGRGEDFLACAEKRDEQWLLTYRFRYYNSADPWDGKDEKNWYRAARPVSEMPEERFRDSVTMTVDLMVLAGYMAPGKKPWVRYTRDGAQLRDEFFSAPFVHKREGRLDERE